MISFRPHFGLITGFIGHKAWAVSSMSVDRRRTHVELREDPKFRNWPEAKRAAFLRHTDTDDVMLEVFVR